MNRFTNVFIAIAGGLLLWAAWPVSSFTVLLFIAWTPLLYLLDNAISWKKFFAATYLHMFAWNILCTWWVWNASLPGGIGAFVANSLLMCVPWLLSFFVIKRWGKLIGQISLVCFWLAFEFLHHNWELSWPWLTLGNGLSTHPEWVQWYEFFGASSGTLWIFLLNIIGYRAFVKFRSEGRSKSYFILLGSWVALLIIPIIISYQVLNAEKKFQQQAIATAKKNIVVVQPNIDPYTEKFSGSVESQIQKLILLSEKQIDDNTSLVIWPETAIPVGVWENEIKQNFFYNPIWSFLNRHPFINLVTGIDSYKVYGKDKSASKTARLDKSSGNYYDAFNTAAFFDADTTITLYHKAKLVPGVETLPSFLNFMGKWFEDLGGTSGTLGRDSERKVFVPWDKHFKVAPIICYESIYGDYITEYVRKGANILAIITNDGWWGNTPGYKQHMNYARLRAIETRKWIARSANTGISCFIDPLGNVIDPQPWDTATAIKLTVPVDNRETFFVQHGDLLSRIAVVLTILGLTASLIIFVIEKVKSQKLKVKSPIK